MARRLRLATLIAAGFLVAACTGNTSLHGGPARLTLNPGELARMPGWSDDRVAAAIPPFLKSCARFLRRPDNAPLDPATPNAKFGTVADWRPICAEAAALPSGDETAARRFLAANFIPVLAGNGGDSKGLFTGYWEVALTASRERQGIYQTPIYRRPPELAATEAYFDRAAIEDGALASRHLELMWIADPADLLALQTQGSGRVRMTDGTVGRLVYDGNNGHAPVALDQLLVARGEIPRAQLSGNAVRTWMADYPDRARAIRRENPAYVFFREIKGDGPIGAEGAVLTAGRSLAVDHRFVPLGIPLWLEAQDRYRPTALHRLVVAQDTGDGIEGPVRGDFYWGSGPEANAAGGNFYADGHYYLMVPRHLAMRNFASR